MFKKCSKKMFKKKFKKKFKKSSKIRKICWQNQYDKKFHHSPVFRGVLRLTGGVLVGSTWITLLEYWGWPVGWGLTDFWPEFDWRFCLTPRVSSGWVIQLINGFRFGAEFEFWIVEFKGNINGCCWYCGTKKTFIKKVKKNQTRKKSSKKNWKQVQKNVLGKIFRKSSEKKLGKSAPEKVQKKELTKKVQKKESKK